MAQILVRNIDDEALAGLRARAKNHKRSLEAEVRMLIEREGKAETAREAFWRRADEFRAAGQSFDPTDSAELRKIGRRGE